MLGPGDIIADRYEIEELIGEGGLAQVWKVRHRDLGSLHALKMLLFRKPRLAERLILEGRIQAQLRHPNIVTVTDVVRHGGQVGLVMEFVDGVALQTWLEVNAPLDVDRALELFAPILAGVRAAHDAGVLHRDLKPANILLARHGRGLAPKVTDFGIAKVVEGSFDAVETRTGAIMGTPGYLAPEQAVDASRVDRRADIFALGAILYEMLTGRRAFDSLEAYVQGKAEPAPLLELRPDIPVSVVDAVHRAMAWDPGDRFPEVLAFSAALFDGRPGLLEQVGSTTPQSEGISFSASPRNQDQARATVPPRATATSLSVEPQRGSAQSPGPPPRPAQATFVSGAADPEPGDVKVQELSFGGRRTVADEPPPRSSTMVAETPADEDAPIRPPKAGGPDFFQSWQNGGADPAPSPAEATAERASWREMVAASSGRPDLAAGGVVWPAEGRARRRSTSFDVRKVTRIGAGILVLLAVGYGGMWLIGGGDPSARSASGPPPAPESANVPTMPSAGLGWRSGSGLAPSDAGVDPRRVLTPGHVPATGQAAPGGAEPALASEVVPAAGAPPEPAREPALRVAPTREVPVRETPTPTQLVQPDALPIVRQVVAPALPASIAPPAPAAPPVIKGRWNGKANGLPLELSFTSQSGSSFSGEVTIFTGPSESHHRIRGTIDSNGGFVLTATDGDLVMRGHVSGGTLQGTYGPADQRRTLPWSATR